MGKNLWGVLVALQGLCASDGDDPGSPASPPRVVMQLWCLRSAFVDEPPHDADLDDAATVSKEIAACGGVANLRPAVAFSPDVQSHMTSVCADAGVQFHAQGRVLVCDATPNALEDVASQLLMQLATLRRCCGALWTTAGDVCEESSKQAWMGPVGTVHHFDTADGLRSLDVQFDYDVAAGGTALRVLRSPTCGWYIPAGSGKKQSCAGCDAVREAARKREQRRTIEFRAAVDSDSTTVTLHSGQSVTIPHHVMNDRIPTESLSSVRHA
jgi:hypothetical protein